MDPNKISVLHDMVKRHQQAVQRGTNITPRPVGAGLDSDDLSKVASTEAIDKGGSEETLRK